MKLHWWSKIINSVDFVLNYTIFFFFFRFSAQGQVPDLPLDIKH